MVPPIRSFRLFAYVMLLLGGITLLFPSGEIPLGDYSLTLFNWEEVFIHRPPVRKDSSVAEVVAMVEQLEALEQTASDSTSTADSLATTADSTKQVASREKLLDAKKRIQFPEGKQNVLDHFFAELHKTLTDSTAPAIHILHYGDSQLEGDRITSRLRKRFQGKFGGCGAGLLPLTDPIGGRTTLKITSGGPWKRHIIYGHGYKKDTPRNYGVLGSYFDFAPKPKPQPEILVAKVKPDSLKGSDSLVAATPDSITQVDSSTTPIPDSPKEWRTAWVNYQKGYSKIQWKKDFNRLKILYGPCEDTLQLTLTSEKDTIGQYILPPRKYAGNYAISIHKPFKDFKLTFEGYNPPPMHGVCMECRHGVAVDNISFRGSSGTEFWRMDQGAVRTQVKLLNAKFLIVQYGVNVVPGQAKSYDFYERAFYKQLKRLKALAPNMDILVVGVSDMAYKNGEIYESYPNIEMIRDAQKNAAFKADCAFFDLYEAMGGKNAMVSWVEAEKPLAGKDYTHFTPRGARIVGEMLYNALILQYEDYVKNLRTN